MSDCQVSFGNDDSKRTQLVRGRFWGWGTTKPRRTKTRWMVDTLGALKPASSKK